MNLSTVTDVLNARVDDLSRRGCPCWEGVLIRFREAGKVMGACGHDTSELEQAIDVVEKAMIEMNRVRDKVVSKFKADGICFCVDENKRREIEIARLQ